MSNNASAGWFPDPENADQLRWWDGKSWTEHRHSAVELDAAGTEDTIPLVNGTVPGAIEGTAPASGGGQAVTVAGPSTTPRTVGRAWWRRGWFVAPAAFVIGAVVGASGSGSETTSTRDVAAPVAQPTSTVTVTAAPTSTPTVTVTKTATVTKTVTAKPRPKHTATHAGSASEGAALFVLPDETGKSLQGAQDDLQEISGDPFYVSFSEDATGQGRSQILDADWQVCSSRPAAGSSIGELDEVTFRVVRVTETCP